MPGIILRIICLLSFMVLVSEALAGKDKLWLTDMAKAERVAKKENKDIFIFFTGSDWCGWCVKFKDKVLGQRIFLRYANDKLVLVELDFPQSEGVISKSQRIHNEKWKAYFQVANFPSVYITDMSMKLYAISGYITEEPEKYVDTLKKLKLQKTIKEKSIAKADKASGLRRAKLLDEALSQGGAGLVIENSDALKNEILQLSKKDSDLYRKYILIKASEELGAEMKGQIPLKNPQQGLQRSLKLFAKYSRLREGQPLAILLNNLGHNYSWAGKLDEGITFMNRLYKDASYTVEIRQVSGLLKAHLVAEKSDMEKAVSIMDEALALMPESRANQFRDDYLRQLKRSWKLSGEK